MTKIARKIPSEKKAPAPEWLDPFDPPRTVKPRRPTTTSLPLIAAGRDGCYSDSTGEVADAGELPELIREHPPAVIACLDPSALLAILHREFRDDPLWQFRLIPVERSIEIDDRRRVARESIVAAFGWQRRNGRRRNRYFYPVAPFQFGHHQLGALVPDEGAEWQRLYRWACAVRSFCEREQVRLSPTAGGIAAQLLRDRRFYPEPRRKVPTRTNEHARPTMPGNYYELLGEPGTIYAAGLLIDQESAHHYAAATTTLPDADRLYARGRFSEPEPEPWIRPERDREAWAQLREQHGLVWLTLDVPATVAEQPFQPPYLRHAGRRPAYLYTNELREAIQLGARPVEIHAAWTADRADRGLPAYSQWARATADASPADAAWMKGLLLAAYGILGAKPRRLENQYLRAKKGDDAETWIGAERVPVKVIRTAREHQSPIANVIQRGMIEATTRRLSLELARDLNAAGRRILAIYADAVIVHDREPVGPLPLMPPPWRIKERLTWLRFHSPQSYEALEQSRFPGVPRDTLSLVKSPNTRRAVA